MLQTQTNHPGTNITVDCAYFKQIYKLSSEIQDYVLNNAKMSSPANGREFSTAIALIDSEKEAISAYTQSTFDSKGTIKWELMSWQQDFWRISRLMIVALDQ